MNEGDRPTLKHMGITVPRPARPMGLYYSFKVVIDFVEGRRKGVDGGWTGSEGAKCYKQAWGQQKNGPAKTLSFAPFSPPPQISEYNHKACDTKGCRVTGYTSH